MPEAYLLTPGGFKPASNVHHVRPDHVVRMRDHVAEIHHFEFGLVKEVGPIEPHATNAPLLPKNLSLRPPGGAGVDLSLAQTAPGVGPALVAGAFPQVDGWISYTGWNNRTGNPISRLVSTWAVPPEPATREAQTIFLFNGIQNSTMIYQPVLQWGPSAAGGGQKWSVATWYADSQTGHSFFSDLVDVAVGQVLVGLMELTGHSGTLCSYSAEFIGIANTKMPIAQVEELTWANETLEAYAVTSREHYPATAKTTFSAITLETGSTDPGLAWDENNPHIEAGNHVKVVDGSSAGGEVEIWYEGE